MLSHRLPDPLLRLQFAKDKAIGYLFLRPPGVLPFFCGVCQSTMLQHFAEQSIHKDLMATRKSVVFALKYSVKRFYLVRKL